MNWKQLIPIFIIIWLLVACTPAATSPLPMATEVIVPTLTALPSVVPTPALFEPIVPSNLIAERLDAVIASYLDLGNYPFTSSQVDHLHHSVEYAHIHDEKLNLDRYYWLISAQKLVELQEPELAEMLGYIPLAYSEDGKQWQRVGLKDATDIPVGAEYSEPDEDPIEIRPSTHEFDFGIINSLWGSSAFGDTSTGKQESIFKFISRDQNDALTLDPMLLVPGWNRYENFWAMRSPYKGTDIKHMDKTGQGRRLIALPVIYPGNYGSEKLPLDFDQLSREQALSLLQQYVTAFVNSHKGQFFAYVGVTEFGLSGDDLMKELGPEYIDVVFKSIRDADPTAVLILEHDGNQVPLTDMTEVTLETAIRLKEKGLIDYVAVEAHIDIDPYAPESKSMEEIKQVLASYPVPVFLSSIDVNTSEYKDDPQRFLIQAEKVREILQPALELGTPYISFWGGFPDNRSWLVTGGQPDAAPTMWTDTWQEKPMYFTIQSMLLKHYLERYR